MVNRAYAAVGARFVTVLELDHDDMTWKIGQAFFWAILEICVGLTCSSLPTMRNMLLRLLRPSRKLESTNPTLKSSHTLHHTWPGPAHSSVVNNSFPSSLEDMHNNAIARAVQGFPQKIFHEDTCNVVTQEVIVSRRCSVVTSVEEQQEEIITTSNRRLSTSFCT
jgi:hypothetical protein